MPASYDMVGVVLQHGVVLETLTWAAFFAAGRAKHPGRVVVPDSADDVIGAVLVSLGHAWDSDSSGDLDDASARLEELFPSLRVLGRRVPSQVLASQHCRWRRSAVPARFACVRPGMRFLVPRDGSALEVRSYCIPVYAPHPVAAHGWLQNWLDPVVEAGAMTQLAPVPLEQARAYVQPDVLADQAICPPTVGARRQHPARHLGRWPGPP